MLHLLVTLALYAGCLYLGWLGVRGVRTIRREIMAGNGWNEPARVALVVVILVIFGFTMTLLST